MGLFSKFSRSGDKPPKKPKTRKKPVEEMVVLVDSSMDPHLVVYHDPKSVMAEQYRQFRTNLLALNRDGSPLSLVFTSSAKGEGKSISLANIALSLAEYELTRVCLVDSDFRDPSLARMFGLDPSPGLAELLQEGLPLRAVLRETKVDDLYLIPSGREPRNPTELLGSDRLVSTMNALKGEFRYVLFDTPPVFPFSDASILGSKCNGIVLVIRMERTNRNTADRTVQLLESAGGKVLGTFLTGLRMEEKEYGADYYYYGEGTE